MPDVLIQAHSASMRIVFYNASQFPAEDRGDGFVAVHGSWNRSKRTGYKVIRLRLKDGVPTGEYEDFMTGFIVDDASVWGRPVGVAVAQDGTLLASFVSLMRRHKKLPQERVARLGVAVVPFEFAERRTVRRHHSRSRRS